MIALVAGLDFLVCANFYHQLGACLVLGGLGERAWEVGGTEDQKVKISNKHAHFTSSSWPTVYILHAIKIHFSL